MTLEKTKKAILNRIENSKEALAIAEEALEKGNFDEVENQLDIAASECCDGLSIAETLVI